MPRAVKSFPSFSEGLSLRVHHRVTGDGAGTFFPSFSEGLSLRVNPC